MKSKHSFLFILAFMALLIASSCTQGNSLSERHDKTDTIDTEQMRDSDSIIFANYTDAQIDSLNFRVKHHYSINYNFAVKSDSLVLVPQYDDINHDTTSIYKGDIIVVANTRTIHQDSIDSIWIKVARDQYTMGWIRESELLHGTVPDDMISQLISSLSSRKAICVAIILGLGIIAFMLRRAKAKRLVFLRFDVMDSFYPPLFLILVATLTVVYVSIQNFAPWYWQEYFYHPSINPLVLPRILALLVSIAWVVLIVLLAIVDEAYHHFSALHAIYYVAETLGIAMVVFLFFSWTTVIYVGYLLLPIFIAALLYVYFKYIRCRYVCGNCGKKIHSKGRCPHCGKMNE